LAVNIPAPARRRSTALRALVLAVLCAACENGITPPKTDNTVATVAVTAPATTLQNGSSMQLSAAASNAAGEPLTKNFTWTSSSDAVATVAADGTVTGKSPGVVTITATTDGKSGSVNLTIAPIPIATVSVSPDTATLMAGTTRQLAAVGRDASGGVLTGRLVAWASADSMIAKVSPTGLVTARAVGSVVITATSEGKSGTATITVVPVPIATVTVSPDTATVLVGAARQLAAIAWDAAGAPLTGRPVTWASADSMIASVSSLGLVTGRAAGSVVVTATSEGKSGTATITVKPATATLRIGIVSQGDLPDPDGYEILYNGQSMGKFGGTRGVEVENLQPGQYTVAIRNVSLYCGVNGSRDRTVTLTAGETTEVDFVVQCRRDGLGYIIYDGSRSWNYVHFPGRDTIQVPGGNVLHGSRMRWSPDGRRLLYTSAPAGGGATAPTYVDLDSLRVVRLPVTGIQPDPSPDGTRIAYANVRAIRTMRWDGTDVTTIWEAANTTSIFAQMPTWSPDGSRIAFIKSDFSVSPAVAYIVVVNADGSGERVVRTLRTLPYLHLDWSPDGSRIVYPDKPDGGTFSIYTANVETGDETLLIGAAGVDYVHPEYLRDGRIGFVTRPPNQLTNQRIWTINPDGTGLTERVVPGVTTAHIPAWQ
jgi:uncharacterized protein YjdB